eukprot:scaffold29001_cov67-Phaeocystis_antarctica.AAC.4
MRWPSRDCSIGHGTTVPHRNPSAITAKRTCFITASSSASGRSLASHHRLIHRKTASSLLATRQSSCTSATTSAPVASCAGNSSKPRSAASTAAFSSAGSVKTSASRHTLSALDGASRALIASAHASLSASTTRRADASSTSRFERLRTDALERAGGVCRVAHARLEEVQEVLRAGGECHPVGLELDALGTDGEVGEPLVAPEAGERGVVWRAAAERELGCGGGASGLRIEDEVLVAAAAVRARFLGAMVVKFGVE